MEEQLARWKKRRFRPGPLEAPLQEFLEPLCHVMGDGTRMVQLRGLVASLEELGFTFDEFPPPPGRPDLRVLSTPAYLQIVSEDSAEVIPLNLQEFAALVHDVVMVQYGAVARSYTPPLLTFDRIRALASRVVLDPTGVLRGGRATEAQVATPPAAAPPVQLVTGLLRDTGESAVASFMQTVAAAAAQFMVPKLPALQPQAREKPAPGPSVTSSALLSAGSPALQSEASLSGAPSAAQGEFFESIEDTTGSAEEPVSFDPAALQDVLATGLRDIATPVIGRAPPVLGQAPSTPQIAARKELDDAGLSRSRRGITARRALIATSIDIDTLNRLQSAPREPRVPR